MKTIKQLSTGLWCCIDNKGRVSVYTNEEYQSITHEIWFKSIIKKFFSDERK
jgi:hypothetical protein